MKNIKKYKIIITTSNSIQDIQSIRDKLLLKKISPCIQIINNIESSYIWKDEIVLENEVMILIKADSKHESLVVAEIEKHHSYDTPEIISYDFEILSDKYKKWFDGNIKNK